MRSLLALGLTLALAAPVAAEEIITALTDRWYVVSNADPVVVIPESGVIGPITICLDEVPGGLDSTPSIRVTPVATGKANRVALKQSVQVTREGFSPLGHSGEMAYVSVVLRGVPGAVYTLGVVIRGKQ